MEKEMETAAVNWEALDALVTDFAESENLIDGPPSVTSSSGYNQRLLIRHVRRSLLAGDIDNAVESLNKHAPEILLDHRLLFTLHKQRMETTTVNLEALDALITDFAESEHLIDCSPSATSSSGYNQRLLICQVRLSLLAGDIDGAVELLNKHAPGILLDHRVLFTLHKQMETTAVNWEVLDALVTDFAESKHLIDTPPSATSSSGYNQRLLICHVRCLLLAGDIDGTVESLNKHAPGILLNHRLLFTLHKQKFIELLRRGTLEDRDSAICCLQTALAPCALDAYPEAYEEFKHVLLAFIYDKDDDKSPVANEWSEKRRLEIAGKISSVLRAHLQAYDPILCMTLRYLISIHKGFCLSQQIVSPISNLTERLLLEEHDPPATPQESSYEPPPFKEEDIQALAHAVQLTRQGAVDSLRFAKGDLFRAFQNELCRMRMDMSVLDDLVHEYCVYRGIVESSLTSPAATIETDSLSGPRKLLKQGSVDCSFTNGSVDSDSECVLDDHGLNVSSESSADMMNIQTYDSEDQYSSETRNNHENCSTSGTHQPEAARTLQRNRSCGPRERCKRKRWMWREDSLDLVSEKKDFGSHNMVDLIRNNKEKYESVLTIKELASRGMAVEAVEEVNTMDPKFFTENPVLLFQLKQVEFLKLVSSGDNSSALKVACSHLGPLATKVPALLKPLKETMLTLLISYEGSVDDRSPLHALGSSLQVVIGKRLGFEEPQLMKIMRATMFTHNEWFKLQMWKDRFEGLLKIEPLKDVDHPLISTIPSKSNIDTCTDGPSQGTMSSSSNMQGDGSCSTQVSSFEPTYDDNAIIKVMEFLDLPRAEAIHLLAQYDGNAETVIQQLFG